jgi:hypothetical protein
MGSVTGYAIGGNPVAGYVIVGNWVAGYDRRIPVPTVSSPARRPAAESASTVCPLLQ